MTEKSEIYSRVDRGDSARSSSYDSSIDDYAPPSSDPHPVRNLLDTIEAEILPRLMLVHSTEPADRSISPMTGTRIESETLDQFVNMMIDESGASGREMVSSLIREGVEPERVYLDLLAPAARQMGALWESDVRNFTDVTIGLCRLHEVIRHNALTPVEERIFHTPGTPSILLATACEDQHVFGIIMVAEFFRKDGWHVTCEPAATTEELARISSQQNYDVIGLSVACSVDPKELSGVIQHLRSCSCNSNAKIMLGGALVDRDPDAARIAGADICVTDAARAPNAAMSLLARTRIGC